MYTIFSTENLAPFQITQELPTVTMATEWSSVTLTCTVRSTFVLNTAWGKMGGVLPPASQESYSHKVCDS